MTDSDAAFQRGRIKGLREAAELCRGLAVSSKVPPAFAKAVLSKAELVALSSGAEACAIMIEELLP